MPLEQELLKLGLSDKEAKVYLANLELGESSVQNIAKKAGVNRATTYVILNSLAEKGLCSTIEKEKKNYFVALNPETLESLFELQLKDIEEKKKQFRQILPELKLLNNRSQEKPVVKFFEGKQGLLSCLNEFFLSRAKHTPEDNTSRLLYPKDRIDELFTQEDRQKFKDMRVSQQIKNKTLYNSKNVTMMDTADGIRLKISGKEFPFSCDIGIHGDSVRILTLGDRLSGILITNPDVAKTLKSLFELAWEAAEARQKKSKESEN